MHFCEPVYEELHDKTDSFLVQLSLLHWFYSVFVFVMLAHCCVAALRYYSRACAQEKICI